MNITKAQVNNENIILHLPIKSQNINQNELLEKRLLEYTPELNNPLPFEGDFSNITNISPYPFNNIKSNDENSVINQDNYNENFQDFDFTQQYNENCDKNNNNFNETINEIKDELQEVDSIMVLRSITKK